MDEHKLDDQVLKDTSVKGVLGKQERVIDAARNIWGHPHEAQHDRIVEASHRIKLLNNELHKPGGPLANSSLELIGFDKAGRLLLIQRDQQGKVEGQYLVNSDTGKIVARKGVGHHDQWERGPGYERIEKAQSLPGVFDSQTGATISKDKAGKVHEIVDCHGDKRVYERDAKENVSEIIITRHGQQPEHFKPGAGVAGAHEHLWYKQPHNASNHERGFRFDVKDDGTLIQHTRSTESVTFGVDGSVIENKGTAKEVVKRKGFVREVEQDDKKLLAAAPPKQELA